TSNPPILASAGDIDSKVKRVDLDRWLSSRYAPAAYRRDLMALYAFNHELERALTVSEPTLARIRLQWWRDALEEMLGGQPVRRHDVALVLAAVVGRRSGLAERMLQLIEDYEEAADAGLAAPTAKTGGQLAEAAGRVLADGSLSDDETTLLRRAGGAYSAAKAGLVDAVNFAELKGLRVRAETMPAVAHAILAKRYLENKTIGNLTRRRLVFATILNGRF
ncbi:MAG: squalene/phytoene synthase family protein, partial [Pseudomonadota bacterium]